MNGSLAVDGGAGLLCRELSEKIVACTCHPGHRMDLVGGMPFRHCLSRLHQGLPKSSHVESPGCLLLGA